jgi:hypothetical protein
MLLMMMKYTHFKEITEALVGVCKEIGFEVNAANTKYMIMSEDQNAGQNHSIKNDNSSFERVEAFKYLLTTLMYYIIFRKILRSD